MTVTDCNTFSFQELDLVRALFNHFPDYAKDTFNKIDKFCQEKFSGYQSFTEEQKTSIVIETAFKNDELLDRNILLMAEIQEQLSAYETNIDITGLIKLAESVSQEQKETKEENLEDLSACHESLSELQLQITVAFSEINQQMVKVSEYLETIQKSPQNNYTKPVKQSVIKRMGYLNEIQEKLDILYLENCGKIINLENKISKINIDSEKIYFRNNLKDYYKEINQALTEMDHLSRRIRAVSLENIEAIERLVSDFSVYLTAYSVFRQLEQTGELHNLDKQELSDIKSAGHELLNKYSSLNQLIKEKCQKNPEAGVQLKKLIYFNF